MEPTTTYRLTWTGCKTVNPVVAELEKKALQASPTGSPQCLSPTRTDSGGFCAKSAATDCDILTEQRRMAVAASDITFVYDAATLGLDVALAGGLDLTRKPIADASSGAEVAAVQPPLVVAEPYVLVHASQLESLDQICLAKIMSFLSPPDWGHLCQTSELMAMLTVPICEILVAAFLPPHLLTPTVKTKSHLPDPWTIDELRQPVQSMRPRSLSQQPISKSTVPWGVNMASYQALVTMDVTGRWRVSGTCTTGERYDYAMSLEQVGTRRGFGRLEVLVEGQVEWNDGEVMLIGGKIDGNLVILHEIMIDAVDFHLANVVSAIVSADGTFMSGAWLQHDTVPRPSSSQTLLSLPSNSEPRHRPFRVICSGIFTALKEAAAASVYPQMPAALIPSLPAALGVAAVGCSSRTTV